MAQAPPPPDPELPSMTRVRDELTLRVEGTSLRNVAREVGMSPSGLDRFLDGSVPYAMSRRKLFSWWIRHAAEEAPALKADAAARALEALVSTAPEGSRSAAAGKLLDHLEHTYGARGSTPPPWIRELRERQRAPSGG